MNEPTFNPTEADEREYLSEVTRRISRELNEYSEKVGMRLAEARHLVETLQEHKRDLDHAEKANMRQAVNLSTRIGEHGVDRQRRLVRLLNSPYFGRIDVRKAGQHTPHPVYIGMHAFHDPETEEQIIHDWRAPVSSVFYEHELGEAYYDAPSGRVNCEIERKRQYRIDNRELIFMLETSLSIQDDVLQQELSRASSETMKNIVATIQRDQNAIIRNEDAHSLIIQGAAGSGKTSIALHRIAFLLYRFKDSMRSEDILIISPNKVFAHYISQVLPELGEEMIRETTMEEIASLQLGAQYRFESFGDQVARLLEADDDAYAERVKFKGNGEFLRKLNAYMRFMRATNVLPTSIDVGVYTLPEEWVAERFEKYAHQPINEQLIQVLSDISQYMEMQYQKKIKPGERAQLRKDLTQMFEMTSLKAIYRNFYAWIRQPEMLQTLKGGRYEYADVFPLIYLQRLVDRPPAVDRVKHVVVDEMQDYTAVQYQVLASLFPCRKTILGDHNQSVSPLSSSSAEAIREVLDQAECMYMHKSYRSSVEITKLAQTIHHNPNLEPIERHGEQPQLLISETPDRELDAIRNAIQAFHDSEHNALGIICKTQSRAEQLYDAIKDDAGTIHLLDARSTTFTSGVMIATAYLAKGLEFDEVIVPFCTDAEYHRDMDRHLLYVACTRAMHRLIFTATGSPSSFLQTAIDDGFVATN
ncbi:MAG: helicase [Phycisphaerales bacterium]|nr:MAG: helicase [Phycisphaerales bacterium]